MKNMFAILAATTTLSVANSAYSIDEQTKNKSTMEYKDNGGYESKRSTEHTTPDGTTHSSESKVDVEVDSSGNIDKTIKTESTVDPKGMWNKKDSTSETQIEEKANGGYKQTTTRKYTDANGTKITYKTVTEVDVDNAGNVTSTATTEKTVDPKGLMNETTTKSKTKAVNGRVIEKTTKSN